MRLLGIECATENCSVALFEQGELIGGTAQVLGRGHAEALIPLIAALPGKGQADRIAVSLGPGSFTGLRVGLAAARALALAWHAELVGYSTHALVAAMARAQAGDQPVSVAMNGGHGEWFVSEFGADGDLIAAPQSLVPSAAAATAQSALIAGSQAGALVAARGSGQALAILPDARQLHLLDPADFTSHVHLAYGRAPDARLPGGVLP